MVSMFRNLCRHCLQNIKNNSVEEIKYKSGLNYKVKRYNSEIGR